MPTFGSGTVVVQNRMQQESTSSSQASTTSLRAPPTVLRAHRRLHQSVPLVQLTRSLAASASRTRLERSFTPLLNISVHEHAWLNDYGIMGKEEYLTRFWNCVNWDKVEERFDSYCPQSSRYL